MILCCYTGVKVPILMMVDRTVTRAEKKTRKKDKEKGGTEDGEGVEEGKEERRKRRRTRSSATAEGPRDASCQLKSCQLPGNSAETTCTTSPEQI